MSTMSALAIALDDPIVHIDTPTLHRMADHAYWSAAAAWAEYREACPRSSRDAVQPDPDTHPSLERMLRESAESADDYYYRLCNELNRRDQS